MSAPEKDAVKALRLELKTAWVENETLKNECNTLSRAVIHEKQRRELFETLLADCQQGRLTPESAMV